ncbi:hypothetical protein [Colwellia sp. MB02u-9]|uniref:hypothetical protein n=1 Tax=Colwellia sp. MB02u-9 TaxID=2759823 RepID=UPI0015F597FA|nr:hypothetical protein [Colwellia sp. MB02u-9]MBA6295971.1 hypothetical protein [Colwellia sp. MB02u-9]
MSNTINLKESDIPFEHERETKIRDHYAANLDDLRPNERLIGCEVKTKKHNLSVDMQTVDHNNVLRLWEFKVVANYSAIGQLLVYIAQKKIELLGSKRVIGVIAAVDIPEFIVDAINMSDLHIELVKIPKTIINCGLISQVQSNNNLKINYPQETQNV